MRGRQWLPNNHAQNNDNSFVEEAIFLLYWLSFSKVKAPNFSGWVCMPDYIFNSWEDISKCGLITPPSALFLAGFWLTNQMFGFELTHAGGYGESAHVNLTLDLTTPKANTWRFIPGDKYDQLKCLEEPVCMCVAEISKRAFDLNQYV